MRKHLPVKVQGRLSPPEDLPRCTYYFGPFDSDKEASSNTPGYIEDLESEGARRVSIRIKRCQPSELTICESEAMQF
ncbi:DUF1816 domain-containing protein [Candidatus Gracilibacteria bacterium]|nr:DUF1816 domain-containing protein [Candidatus Gracilibacteria bacterium]